MAQHSNQVDLEQLKENIEKYKTPFLLIIAAFVFSGPLMSLLNIFIFNMYFILFIIIVVVLLFSIKQINQYERGVKFTIGKFAGLMEPGWRIVIPVFQSYQKIDMRVRAVDVPNQEAITKDNISVTVNAVIYYKISEAEKAILEVEDVYYAVSQLAQTTMRNVAGEVDLDELLSNRDTIAERIRAIVDKATDAWGVKVNSVELKDVTLPEEMKRVIGRQAEAEREKRSVIIQAEGEVMAAENLAKAANVLSSAPGALHLRTLNTLNDVSSDKSNTIVFVTPIEVLRALERFGVKKD